MNIGRARCEYDENLEGATEVLRAKAAAIPRVRRGECEGEGGRRRCWPSYVLP